MIDLFMKIEGVEGESSDDKHQKWMELLSLSLGVAHQGGGAQSSQGSLAGGHRADFHDISFSKHLDGASTTLMLGCAGGQHFPSALIQQHRAGETKELFIEVKLTDVMISSYQLGSHGDLPMEQLSLNFGKFEMKYMPTKVAGGKAAGVKSMGWDLKTNKKV
jgi:type VI secretion system secreted protein Hcp